LITNTKYSNIDDLLPAVNTVVNVTSLPEEAVTAIYPKQQHLNIFITTHVDISSVTGRPKHTTTE